MFGLMTVARHERAEVEQRLRYEVWYAWQKESIEEAKAETAHWRKLAEAAFAAIVDIEKRQAPPVPGPDEAEIGAIADDDWTPSAIAKRERAVGAKG